MLKTKRFCILLILLLNLACSTEKKTTDDANKTQNEPAKDPAAWTEMDEFHMVMADSFHPYMDSTNLAPAKLHAEELARIAEKWAVAELPEKVNNEEVRKLISTLNVSAQDYLKTVRSNNDEAIGKSLTALHDLFHQIQDAWYHSGGDHHH